MKRKNCQKYLILKKWLWKIFLEAQCELYPKEIDASANKHLLKTSNLLTLMSKLLIERLTVVDQPFTHTATDYFGSLLVKLNKKTWANQVVAKRCGAIFTWLSSCALHIKLAGDLSTNSFILALHRFISRRSYHKFLISYNGPNFVGAQWELSETLGKLDNYRINNDLNQRYIMHDFNPPSALWMGGDMKSMVKITKKALK